MKKLIFPIGLTVLILSSLSAYDLHLPWCDGPEDHKNNPECHAYAMARAFGHGEDSSEICPAITAPGNIILIHYFDK